MQLGPYSPVTIFEYNKGKPSSKQDTVKQPRDLILIGQPSNSRFGWRLCGVLTLAALVIASLLLPPQLEQLRTGHWEVEHFLAYFAAVPIVCLGWPRPFLAAVALTPVATLLEAMQSLSPGHSPNFLAALSSVGGVLAGALLATLIIRAGNLQASFKERRKRLDRS
jgi:VanZ family protein